MPIQDLAVQRNPYNFSNPVRRRELFSGREQQIADIAYYLDDARYAEQPVNLAILGARASGKTSLLNLVALEAAERGIAVARVNLNEGDTQSPMAFFHKLIHNLIVLAFDTTIAGESDSYAFGGRQGSVAVTYDNLITTGKIPEEGLFLEFGFPLFCARTASNERSSGQVFPENLVTEDLKLISQTLNRPIALLFDECDVLTSNRVLLQMLRNICQDLERFVVVLCGTPALFETFDDVFSPIVRQFKKIEVGPYALRTDIENCIRKPLETLIGRTPDTLFNFSNKRVIDEIQKVTGGSAYEIQLLCHFMYRSVQQGRTRQMQLTSAVIDAVRKELGTGHTLASRPLFGKLQSYDAGELRLLRGFLQGELYFSLAETRMIIAIASDSSISEIVIRQALDKFEADGILRLRNEKVAFAGDELDRIYARYYARSQQIYFPRTGSQFITAFELELRSKAVLYGLDAVLPPHVEEETDVDSANGFAIVSRLLAIADDGSPLNSFSESEIVQVYQNLFLDFANEKANVSLCRVTATGHFGEICFDTFSVWNDGFDKVARFILDIKAMESDIDIVFDLFVETLQDRHIFALPMRLRAEGPATAVTNIGHLHTSFLAMFYESHEYNRAIFHGRAAVLLGIKSAALNLAYVLMSQARLDEAYELLIKVSEEPGSQWIAYYDLSVICAQRQEIQAALEWLAKAQKILTELEAPEALFLFRIDIKDGGLVFNEVKEPDSAEVIDAARLALQLFAA